MKTLVLLPLSYLLYVCILHVCAYIYVARKYWQDERISMGDHRKSVNCLDFWLYLLAYVPIPNADGACLKSRKGMLC